MNKSINKSTKNINLWLLILAVVIASMLLIAIRSSVGFYRIPSGSMAPALQVGDLIVVNRFQYGVNLPIINKRITDGEPVVRGDVIVFRYPPKPSLDYIKRVIGLPGDTVEYINKKITINGKLLLSASQADYFEEEIGGSNKQFEETLDGKKFRVLNNQHRSAGWSANDTEAKFLFKQNCEYSDLGVRCKVPQGHYFTMGDNRDNALDSRYFGFIPHENLVGKALFVWWNSNKTIRIGNRIE